MSEQQGTESPLRFIVVMGLIVLAVIGYFIMQPDVREGQAIFKEEGCVKCHKFHDMGIGIIDLTTVTTRRSDTWIEDQVRYPRQHDRGSGMPSFDHLSPEEMDNLISFLHEGPKK